MKQRGTKLIQPYQETEARAVRNRLHVIRSMDESFIQCLECGRRLQTLGLHLLRAHAIDAGQYREKYGLNRGQGLTSGRLRRKKRHYMLKEWKQGRRQPALTPGAAHPHPWVRRFQSLVTGGKHYNRIGYRLAVQIAGENGSVNSRLWRDSVLKELLSPLRKRKAPVSRNDVRKANPELYRYALHLWHRHGGLAHALAREGVATTPLERWDRARVIAEIMRRTEQGLSLNSNAIQTQQPKLYLAARRYFGPTDYWNKALEAAGIDPASVRVGHRRKWTKEKIIATLQDMFRQKTVIGQGRIRQTGLVEAARSVFGSWREAVRASGFTPISPRWDRSKVIARIRERQSNGLPINSGAVEKAERALLHAATRYFGKPGAWNRALAAAGADPTVIRKLRVWSDETIRAEILALRESGKSLRNVDVNRENPSLLAAVYNRGRTWRTEVARALSQPRRPR